MYVDDVLMVSSYDLDTTNFGSVDSVRLGLSEVVNSGPMEIYADSLSVSELQYEVTLNVYTDGQGAVQIDPTGPHPVDSDVELTAVPNDGWEFFGWSGDLTGTDNPGYSNYGFR